jgi:hypothetical protein
MEDCTHTLKTSSHSKRLKVKEKKMHTQFQIIKHLSTTKKPTP